MTSSNKPARGPASPKSDPGRHLAPDGSDIPDRMFATLLGLHRICVFRLCRRRKRCLGPNRACFRHHTGLAKSRFRHMLASGRLEDWHEDD